MASQDQPDEDDREPRLDGGVTAEDPLVRETRERLRDVETQVATNGEILGRVEGKMDNLRDEVREVDDEAMGRSYFKTEYSDQIERNSTIVAIMVWSGGILLALAGLVISLLSAGIIP